ncbi:MAG TPA: nuclear transport factor 2 family protein [Candidatus Angelobacter sp.]|nr:nuclear transport factor 2 family protein [Candidatus Angelobacter sp.]
MNNRIAAVFAFCLLAGCCAVAQNPAAQPSPAPSIKPPATAPASTTPSSTAPSATARPGDVDSIDHIIAAVYDVISGPAGPRDWDRFRSFYYPGARMIPSRRDDKGVVTARVSSPDEYATRAKDFFSKEGFLRTQSPTAWSSGTTLRMCGARMSRATPKVRSPLRAASTVFSFSMTAHGGGSSPSTGKVKIHHTHYRKST